MMGRTKMAVRTLIVDDSLDARGMLRHHLECIGCQVVAEIGATSQVLDLFRTLRPSLVALGADAAQVGPGRLEKAELIRLIRGEDRAVPILVVGAARPGDVGEAAFRSEDLKGCVVSPFEAPSLGEVRNRIGELFGEAAGGGPCVPPASPNRGRSASCPS